jgi:hypothetical protein
VSCLNSSGAQHLALVLFAVELQDVRQADDQRTNKKGNDDGSASSRVDYSKVEMID